MMFPCSLEALDCGLVVSFLELLHTTYPILQGSGYEEVDITLIRMQCLANLFH